MKKRLISIISGVLILNLLLSGCSNANKAVIGNNVENTVVEEDKDLSSNIETLDAEGIVTQLASDEFLSRVVGSEENLKSATFVKDYFESIGLEPFVKGSYYHDVKANDKMRTVLSNVDNGLEVKNVIGVIKGEDSSKAVVISAHFDHIILGSRNSSDGKVTKLQGAVDNASGISILLESAKDLVKNYEGDKPPHDIIFAAFNAEELGLIGSYAFVNDYADDYDQWYNINIDCVGVKGGKGLAMENNSETCQELYDDFIKILDKNDVPYENVPYARNSDGVIVGTSDHAIFKKFNSAALIIGQDGIVDIVHTEADNLSVMDYESIENIKDALVDFIISTDSKIY